MIYQNPGETYEEGVARRASERIAEDEAVTEEMIQAAVDAVGALDTCNAKAADVYAAAYRAMRRAKREAEHRLACSGWVLEVFKPLPEEERKQHMDRMQGLW